MVKRRGKGPNRTATRRPDLHVVRDLEVLAVGDPGAQPGEASAEADAGPAQQVAAMAAALLHDIGRCRRPLEVEVLVGEMLGLVARGAPEEEDAQSVEEAQRLLLTALVEAFGAAGGAAGLAGLRALAAIGPSELRERATQHADRIAAAGLPEPRWAATIGRPAFVRAWRYGDVFGGQTSIGVVFDYARREHAVLTLIDHFLGGGVKDCFLVEGRDVERLRTKAAARMEELTTAYFDDIDVATAAEQLSQALEVGSCPVQDDQVEDVARYHALLVSRTVLMAELAGLPEPAAAAGPAGRVLRVKVTLAGIEPPIWRRVELPAGLLLDRLHAVLQTAFGWEGAHPHVFELPPPEQVRQHLPYAGDEALPEIAEDRIRVGHVLRAEGDELVYRYDFGDDWTHLIVVEACTDPADGVAYPRCTDGRRNAPPEDSGGVPGYQHLLAALADPGHAEHEELSEWAPGFDPEAFSCELVDDALSRLR